MSGLRSSEARPLEVMGLLERGSEHRALLRALNALPGSRGRVVAVVGPPGAGKTALAGMARTLGSDAGVQVLRARGAELEQCFAFGAVRQLFERFVRSATPEEREALFAEAASGARAVLDPQLAAGLTQESPFELLHGLYWFLVHVADRGPLLLIVDDVHWVDPDSVAFLGYIARRVEDLPVVLVVTARDAEEGEHRHLLAEFATDPAVTVLRPAALSEAAVARLVRVRLGDDVPENYCRSCHKVTGGNPLYVDQLLYRLDDEGTGTLERVGGSAVKETVSHRIASLGAPAVALAQAVAVLGGGELPVAAELAGLDEQEAAQSADRLVRRGFFDRTRELGFVHPIVRAAIYDELAPAERQARHARAADVLIARGAPDEQVTSHILAAVDHSGEEWLAVLLRAADEARRRASLETAAVYLRRALREPGAERVELLRLLGLCEAYSQDLRSGEANLREALELAEDPAQFGRCSLSLGRLLNVAGETVAAVDVYAAGIRRLGEADPKLSLTLRAELLGSARVVSGLVDAFREHSAALRAAAPEGRFQRVAAAAESMDAAFADGDRETAAALAESVLSTGLSPNQAALYMAVHTLLICERFESAHHYLTEGLRSARMRGSRVTDAVVYSHRALVERGRGALAAARADVELGLEAAGPAHVSRRLLVATLVHCLIEEDALDEAARALAGARLDGPLRDTAFSGVVLAARGRLRLARGDARGALEDLLLAGERERAWGARTLLLPHHWAVDVAMAQAAIGEREAALALSDELLDVAREFGAPGALGVALRTAGVLRGDAGLLEQAVERLRASSFKLELARGELELGTALGRKDGRDHLRDARALAAECAAPALVAQAEARLGEAGGRLPRLQVRGVQALTAQERRVAELAAQDMTNRQIAQELYLTEKTVETHLSSTYRKLAIRSRRHLAAKLRSA